MINKFLFLLFSFVSLAAVPIQDHRLDPVKLSELASHLGVTGNIVEEAQKWLRKPGQELWEIEELSPNSREYVLNWAQENGIYAEWKPSLDFYDAGVVLGATTCRMTIRLNYLIKAWKEGVRFKELFWLTGERPLDKRIDALTDRCATESEAARILWNEADLPEGMRDLPISFIAVPMKSERRPNTEDTIRAWAAVSKPCKALFISDQPFCGYQFAVIKTSLPQEFHFDVAGQAADYTNHSLAAAVTLDSIARWIYQEGLYRK